MLYSTACEYALRALAYLARQPGQYVHVGRVSEQQQIPTAFLSKICHELVKAGFLQSARGPRGGYTLIRRPEEITLYDVKAAIDGLKDLDRCVAGWPQCSAETPCSQHESWRPLQRQIKRYLQETTIADIAASRHESD